MSLYGVKKFCSTQGGVLFWQRLINFVFLYFKFTIRHNPSTGKLDSYYRLVESYRNMEDRICHRTLLNVGFMPEVSIEQLNAIRTVNSGHVDPPFRDVDPPAQQVINVRAKWWLKIQMVIDSLLVFFFSKIHLYVLFCVHWLSVCQG